MKQYQKTKVCYAETDAAGNKKSYITSETAFNKLVKDATEAKEPLPEHGGRIGTFGYKAAESVDEAVALAGGNGVGEFENIEVFLGVFNYAASLRQDNAANELLQAEGYEQQEGIVDVSFAVAQKVERAKMSPEERAIKDLAKGGIVVTPDQLRAALALIAQQSTGAAATA
jgi:hypothetical protein